MRKWMTLLLTLVTLLALTISVSAQEENGHTDHCICGGSAEGVGDHSECEAVTWQPISAAFQAAGVSMSKANFSKLPSGYYYLDGDVTVTASGSIGSKADILSQTPDTVRELYICLNGHNITREQGRVFGYLQNQSTLTICDCSYENGVFKGTVTGGTSASYGSVVYTYTKSVLRIFGGNFVGKDATSGCAFVIACDGCGDVNGNGKYESTVDPNLAAASYFKLYNGTVTGATASNEGGAIKLFHNACMDMYGGKVVGGKAKNGGSISGNKGTITISGGTLSGGIATEKGGNLHMSSGSICIIGGVISDGTLAGSKELCQAIGSDGKLLATYTDLAAGLAAVKDKADRYLRLCADVQSDADISGTVYLDLAGHDLSGVTISGTLYGMDSTTNAYTDEEHGVLTPVSGSPVSHHKTAQSQVGAVRSYLALNTDGGWSFHRFYVGITKLSLKPSTVGVGYKATFAGSETVADHLSSSGAFGYKIWLDPENVVTRTLGASGFGGVRELTLRISHFMDTALSVEENRSRGRQPIYAQVFLRLEDGTEISTTPVSYTFQQITELADGVYTGLSDGQKTAYDAMYKAFYAPMAGWDLENTHHNSDWKSVTQESFHKMLTSSGSTYLIPTGNYVLTEDIDLEGKMLRVAAGRTIRLCLNGHTLSSAGRVMRTYGNLDICDCHADGQEGSIISAASGENAVYAPIFYANYGSYINLFGGNLVATGKVTAAGVCAISHDGGDSNASKPSAVFNIYGGSISGGQVYNNGGLISMWHESTVNIYGGRLFNGKADGIGGGINVGSGCFLNIYGGTVENCTASTAGGIYSAGKLTVSGKPVITGSTGGNLCLAGNGIADMDALEEGAQVGITADGYRILSQKRHVAELVSSDDPDKQIHWLYGRTVLADTDVNELATPAGFTAGFGEACITPTTLVGIPLSGYGNAATRLSKGEAMKAYDELMGQVLAVTDEKGQTMILITCDVIRSNASFTSAIAKSINVMTNVPEENVILNCSHSHSVPEITLVENSLITEYNAMVAERFAKAAYEAMQDRRPASMETGSFEVSAQIDGQKTALNFVRHYFYTDADGVIKYFGDNFGTSTYNSTTRHIWDADPTMHLVRFVRDGSDILMANWRIHPHRTGGSEKYKISADVIGTLRYYMAQKLADTHFMYVQGAAGNINSVSRLTKSRGNTYGSIVDNHELDYVKYGEVLAQAVVDNLGCLEQAQTGNIQIHNYKYNATADKCTEEEYLAAKAVKDAIDADPNIVSNTDKAAAARELSNGAYESYFEVSFVVNRYTRKDAVLPLNTMSIGQSVGFFTAPGELWDTVSIEVEEASPFKTTFCVGYAQEQHNYFVYYPNAQDMEDGVPYKSYESENHRYVAPKTIKDMIAYWKTTLQMLYDNESE